MLELNLGPRSSRRWLRFCWPLLGCALALWTLRPPLWAGDAPVVDAPVKPSVAPWAAGRGTLFERVLALNQVQEPEVDQAAASKAFEALVAGARTALTGAQTPKEKVAALNKVLLAERKVSYLSNLYWRDATLAASLLRNKGNCASTSTLYVVVGAALELPIRMVIVPGHAFARWDDGKVRINIETTHQGVELSDAEYLQRKYQAVPEDIEKLGWGRSLDEKGFFAELLRLAAAHRAGENRLEEALELLDQSEQLAPGRSDIRLWRCKLLADVTGRRSEARQKVLEMLQKEALPPTVATGALEFLAADAAGSGDHALERRYLLAAFAAAPKSSQDAVLHQLAFCHRALKDFRGAVRYMELAAVLTQPGDPRLADTLYSLAILQKNDDRLGDALESIRKARKINPESWNLQVIEAGYLVLNGQREEGLKLFEAVQRPRGDADFYEIMQTWFFAVSKQREKFYPQFEKALAGARSTRILEWIDQDVDLDVYRQEPDFKALVEKHALRLRGK